MSCIREDSLPEIESLQRAMCIAHKLVGVWAEKWNVSGYDFAFDMYMQMERIGDYLKEHCDHIGLEYKYHLSKPPSIAGEAYLDKIWNSDTNDWRKGGTK